MSDLLQALAKWVEKTAPYLGLLGIVFVYEHYTGKNLCGTCSLAHMLYILTIQVIQQRCCVAGLAIFAWLTLFVHKANEAVKKQVSLKSDFRKPVCIAVAVGLAAHVPAVMLLLQSERLWNRFLLITPSPAPLVRGFSYLFEIQC